MEDSLGAWGEGRGVGEWGGWKTDRGVMGKMTLIPGIWRQVAEEESWTTTSNRCNCR